MPSDAPPEAERTRKPGHRVFVAAFAHETNTFHPARTMAFRYSKGSDHPYSPTAPWKDTDVTVVPGVSAHPMGGGTVDGAKVAEGIAAISSATLPAAKPWIGSWSPFLFRGETKSLRAAMPVDAVYLRLHGAMYADGIGPAESVLVGEVRSIVGPRIPIACTFDLHGNIPKYPRESPKIPSDTLASLAWSGDILVGLKTAPHTDGAQTAELAGRILLDTLDGKVRPVSYVLPIGATIEKRFGPPLEAEAEVVRLVRGGSRVAIVRIGGVAAILLDTLDGKDYNAVDRSGHWGRP